MFENLKKIADSEFEEAMRLYEISMLEEENKCERKLKDPTYLRSLGLPLSLPESTINILKKSQAMSKIMPTLPNRRTFYKRHNIDTLINQEN